MSNKDILYIAVGVIVFAALAWYLWPQNKSSEKGVISKPSDTPAPLMVGKNAIYVDDQLPSINVTVSFAVLEKAGFIAIHESKDGKPGATIGVSALLPAGDNRNVLIKLSRISKNGEEMFAMLHADNGNRVWNISSDAPVKDIQGNIIIMKFTVKNDASAPPEVKF